VTRGRYAAAALGLAAALLTGCGSSAGGGHSTFTVFAASSLTETFDTLAKAFEQDHPGVNVVVSFDSSSTLADQISAGAPADVIATADRASMQTVAKAGDLARPPQEFATNTLILVTPKDNPAHIRSLRDLIHSEFLLCDPSAPCGAAGQQVLDNAGVAAKPKSYEPDVKAVLSKVELNEADAGLVYVSDAKAAGPRVDAIRIPRSVDVTNPYFIGVVKDSSHRDLADKWVSLVTSQAGQRVLAKAGFGRP
jgi:molybdate transport system substrate-binding protein